MAKKKGSIDYQTPVKYIAIAMITTMFVFICFGFAYGAVLGKLPWVSFFALLACIAIVLLPVLGISIFSKWFYRQDKQVKRKAYKYFMCGVGALTVIFFLGTSITHAMENNTNLVFALAEALGGMLLLALLIMLLYGIAVLPSLWKKYYTDKPNKQ